MSPDTRAAPAVVVTWLGRAVLIGIGLTIARYDQPEELRRTIVRDALVSAAALEAFLLLYAWHRTHGGGRADAMAEHGAQVLGCGPELTPTA